jgi:hypothetical protein
MNVVNTSMPKCSILHHIKGVLMRNLITVVAAIYLVVLPSTDIAFAGQPLETETARLLPAGKLEVEGTFEYQTSSEGIETALPLLLEYGITRRLELAVEPVFGTSIRPKIGRHAAGVGDLEATLTYLLLNETPRRPAIAFAGEIKAPTAKDRLIGSGKTDYALYAIASRRFERFDIHANLGYTILGKPTGVTLNNIFSFGAAAEFHINERWDGVGEVFANTSAVPGSGEGGDGSSNVKTAELGGGEAFAMLGLRWHPARLVTLSLGAVYDNNSAFLLRPGVSFHF